MECSSTRQISDADEWAQVRWLVARLRVGGVRQNSQLVAGTACTLGPATSEV